VVSASGDGITISTRASALLRYGLEVSGSAPSHDAGDTVEIERAGPRTNWAWEPTTQATVAQDGTFTAVWQTNHIGRFAIKAVVLPPGGAVAASSPGWPTVTVTIYRPSVATLYGPGFWGKRTACGVVLRRSTVGLANRTLPCGTPVAVYYRGSDHGHGQCARGQDHGHSRRGVAPAPLLIALLEISIPLAAA
jgi:hypothetical protein